MLWLHVLGLIALLSGLLVSSEDFAALLGKLWLSVSQVEYSSFGALKQIGVPLASFPAPVVAAYSHVWVIEVIAHSSHEAWVKCHANAMHNSCQCNANAMHNAMHTSYV